MSLRHLFLLLRLICGLGLLYWAFQKADLRELKNFDFSEFHWGWFLLAMCFGGASVWGWSIRWRIFVQAADMQLSQRESFKLTLFADFFNLYFLGPIGADGVRAFALLKRYPQKKLAIAHTILLDHCVGLLAGALLYFVFTRTQSEWLITHHSTINASLLRLTDIVLGGLLLLCLSGISIVCSQRLWNFLATRKITAWSVLPLKSMCYLRPQRRQLLYAQVVSMISVLLGYLAYWATSHAVHQAIPPWPIFAIMPLVDAIAAIPITISGLGIRENLFVELLSSSMPQGAAAALTVSMMGFASIGIWGLIGGIWMSLQGRVPNIDNDIEVSSNKL